jgi:hypothetical protein
MVMHVPLLWSGDDHASALNFSFFGSNINMKLVDNIDDHVALYFTVWELI